MKVSKTRFFILASLMLLFNIVESQTVNVNGYAFLEFQQLHNNIKVKFERIAPTYFTDSTFTDNAGYYNIEIEEGIYNISYSKTDYINLQILDNPIYQNTTLPDQTIETIGLNGELSGQLPSGIYKVGGDIYVPENATLIIEPGTELKFKQDIMFQVFGTLKAEGTNEDSIKFTHYNDEYYWKGIDFKENSSNESIIKYAIVEFSDDRGISVYKCNPSIERSLIQFNSHTSSTGGQAEEDGGGAGICLKYSNTTVKNVIVANNGGVTLGCGIYCSDGNPKISNSIIINNKNPNLYDVRPGGGIQCGYSANLTVENSVICCNENSIGGGIYISGISSYIPNVTIVNCIISDNKCTEYGGGIYFMGVEVSVQSSLFWNNEGGNFHCDDQWLGVNVTTNNNLDSCDAYGNLIFDPQFTNPAISDFTLDSESPCIDAGNNNYVTSVIDFVHNFRIWDGNNDNDSIVDMGCYEYGSQYNPVGIATSIKNPATRVFAFPNPVHNYLNIKIENISEIEIFDNAGKKIFTSNKEPVDVSKLKTGYYIIKVQDKNGVYYSEKIFKY